jgi:hypothetical protein
MVIKQNGIVMNRMRRFSMENTNLDKEWLQIVKEVRESNVSEEEFRAFIESKKREKANNKKYYY